MIVTLLAYCFTGHLLDNDPACLITSLSTNVLAGRVPAKHKRYDHLCASHQASQEKQPSPLSSAASANTLSLNPESHRHTLTARLPYNPSTVPQQHLTCQAIPQTPYLWKQPHTPTQTLQRCAHVVGWHRSFVSGTIAILRSIWVQCTVMKMPAP